MDKFNLKFNQKFKLTRSFGVTAWVGLMSALVCFSFTTKSLANHTPRENLFDVPLDSLETLSLDTLSSEPPSVPSLLFRASVKVNAYLTNVLFASEEVNFDFGKQRFECRLWTEAHPSEREIQSGTAFKITKALRTILRENLLGVKSQSLTFALDATDSEFKHLGLNCDMTHNRVFRKNQGRDFSVGVFNLAFEPIEIILQ